MAYFGWVASAAATAEAACRITGSVPNLAPGARAWISTASEYALYSAGATWFSTRSAWPACPQSYWGRFLLPNAWPPMKTTTTSSSQQCRQVPLVEFAEQVIDRVQHRGGVRFHRDPVLRAQVPEPQRSHDRHHRGAGTLMTAHLQPGWVGPHPVRLVDDGRRQPQHAAFDFAQNAEAVGLRLQLVSSDARHVFTNPGRSADRRTPGPVTDAAALILVTGLAQHASGCGESAVELGTAISEESPFISEFCADRGVDLCVEHLLVGLARLRNDLARRTHEH
jgi:hypothetical protein